MDYSRLDGKKAYEYVFDYCSEKILSGELKLNDKIPTERELAEEMGVSRNSVREVMHMLEITGLIECQQGSGNYVRCDPMEYMMKSVNMVMKLMQIDYFEIFHIRIGYEYAAIRLAIEVATPEELEEMQEILLKMDQPMSSKESAKLDVEFHRRLVSASHNRMLILYDSMLDHLMNQFVENFRTKILMNKVRAEMLRRSHWAIYHALVDKDLELAIRAFDKHFRVVGEQLDKMMQNRKEQAETQAEREMQDMEQEAEGSKMRGMEQGAEGSKMRQINHTTHPAGLRMEQGAEGSKMRGMEQEAEGSKM